MKLADKIVTLHAALAAASLDHAFGGALALAWCTARARATIGIDVNVFVPSTDVQRVVDAIAEHAPATPDQFDQLVTDGQSRLWFDKTPVDVFLDTTDFHRVVATRTRVERFNGVDLPFLSCRDLAVFKAFFDRTKDWADLEEMQANGSLDVDAVVGTLVRYLVADDARIERLHSLT